MGFSDTATYVKASQLSEVQAAIMRALSGLGYTPTAAGGNDFRPSYTPIDDTPRLQVWAERAGQTFIRLYSSHSGIFGYHDGSFVPLLQTICHDLATYGFEISVNDGDSLAILETDGAESRLTGYHSYMLDELYAASPEMELTPGRLITFRGIKFPWQSMEVDVHLIPEAALYDFSGGVDHAIVDFEREVFGVRLPSYYDFDPSMGKGMNNLAYYERLG